MNLSGLSEVFQDDSAELEYCKTDDEAAYLYKTTSTTKVGSCP